MSKVEVMDNIRKARAKESAREQNIKLDAQEKVDEYLQLHRQYKELERRMKELRDDIEPYMLDKGVKEISASNGVGALKVSIQNRAPVNSRYTAYDYDAVAPKLSEEAKQLCVKKVIDSTMLKLAVESGVAPKDVLKMKNTNAVTFLSARY